MSGEMYSAVDHPNSKAFMAELIALFQKHRLAIVPTYDLQVSFHDHLVVVKLDDDTLEFVRSTYVPEVL